MSEIQFGTLHPDGTLTNERVIQRSTIMACPHFILVPEHYRDDGSCRCDEEAEARRPSDEERDERKRRIKEWGQR